MDELIRVISGLKLDALIYTDLGMEPRLQLVSALRLAPGAMQWRRASSHIGSAIHRLLSWQSPDGTG